MRPAIPERKPMNDACEMPLNNATAAEIQKILAMARCIAVVGLSDNPDRDSHQVAFICGNMDIALYR